MIEATDSRQLRDRAGQLLKVCRERLEGTPKADEVYDQVVFDKNRGNLEAALEVCGEQAEKDPDGRYTYLLASLQALSGSKDEALETLEKAIEADPRNRIHAYHDPDFEALRGREAFSKLIAVG
jgi:tetratricopeptide (TPR) repeat protein